MNTQKMSNFNYIKIIWVLFATSFVQSLPSEYNFYREVIDDDLKIAFNLGEISSDRQIKIYYDNKLIVTQQNTPEVISNWNWNFLLAKQKLEKIVPDTETLFISPKDINSEEIVYVYHSNSQIHIYQGEESNTKISVSEPSELNIIVDSGETISIFSLEFKSEKLASIFYENNKLVLTQVATPEETSFKLSSIKSLQTITSDKNKLLFHPSRFSSEIEINIRHQDGNIFVWTGSDQVPSSNIDRPEIIQVITPEIYIPEFNTCFDSGETAEIFPNEFNMKKLVWIFFKNNLVNVTQLGTPEETRKNTEYKYKNMTIISSDVNKLQLHPARISLDDVINVRHENGKIYIWQGSNQIIPKHNIHRPDIVKVIKPINHKPKDRKIVTDKPVCDLGSAIKNGGILTVVPELNLKQSISIVLNNNNSNRVQVQNITNLEVSNGTYYNNSEIIKSSTMPVIYYPMHVNLDLKININNENVGVAEKPKELLSKVNNETEIKIETKQVNYTKKPEPYISVPNILHGTIGSNHTMIISPKELNAKRLVSVSYKNETLEVTQNGTPEESSFNATGDYKNLQIIQPDKVRLFLHLRLVNPNLVINLRHENGTIYIWQGTADQLPKFNVDIPEVVQVIGSIPPKNDDEDEDEEPETTVVQDLNQSISDTKTLTLFSNMYNPDKLVVVNHKNRKINVYQIDRVNDDGNKNPGYEKLHQSIADGSDVIFDPRKINPEKMIIINYIKKKIHVNTADM